MDNQTTKPLNWVRSKNQGQITQAQVLAADEIRALCWKNPFAVAMMAGKIETRTKKTDVRGLVLIVATAKPYDQAGLDDFQNGKLYWSMCEAIEKAGVSNLLLRDGNAIAIANLVDCRPMTEADEEKTFVKYVPGKWCWVFEDVTPIVPFRIKGFQGWRFVNHKELICIKPENFKV